MIDHGLGAITTDIAATVSVGGTFVALVKAGVGALPCTLAPPNPAAHTGQGPGTGSTTVSAEGFPIHRLEDFRNGNCFGTTVAGPVPRAVSVGG